MLKCALALLVVAAAIDATQADAHVGIKKTCDEKCESDFQGSGGRNRRVGHSVIRTTCLASCKTDFDIADAKQTCDAACKAEFDKAEAGSRSRRAAHAFAQTLCEAKCTAAQDVSKGVQVGAQCTAECQADFDAFVPAQTATEFCADYKTKCADDATATAFDGADDDAKTATCETWYSGADAGTLGDPMATTAAGATQACYQYHLSVAVDAGSKAAHCQHARGMSVCVAQTTAAPATAAPATAAQTATEFCADYNTKCADDQTATPFGGADAAAKTATCETWYSGADAGTLGDPMATTAAGATQACYQYHLSVAVDAGSKATHCQHARGMSVCAAARNRRDGHSDKKKTCDADCSTTLIASAKTACDDVCDAEFAHADAVAKAKEGARDRNRRDKHAAAQTACKLLCATPLSAEETAFAEYTEMVVTFANDPAGLQKFVKAEADKCTCANHVGEVTTVCGMACTTNAAFEKADSSGSFASSAAAVVIAGLAAALY